VQEKQLKYVKTRASPSALVYRKAELAPPSPSDFELPSCGRLSPDNRWVKMAQVIPWSEIDILYKQIKGQTNKKPRTYRNLARKDYLAVAKQRRPTRNKILSRISSCR
jgi:hypothetical protein